jgi:hypothetical protein
MENSFIVLTCPIHWWTGWLDMAFLWIPVNIPSYPLKASIPEINYLLIRDPYRRVLMAGYSVIAAWIREVWSG